MKSTFLRTTAKFGICTGALLAVTAIGAATASAATTYTVKAGTTTTGTIAVTGATQALPAGGNQIVFVDTTSNQTLGCTSGGARGVATLGAAVSASVGKINSTTWNTCQGPAGITLTPTQVGKWTIKAIGRTTAAGVTKASVSGVTANVSGTGCSFTVKGTATGTYENATGLLKLAPVANPTAAQKLTVSNASGCFGAIANGHNVTFTANYKLTTAAGGITIKSN